ncbi:MAG: peptide-binding protein [Capsulimonas sp.]|jgi:hypothetical protein|nr:peptide-binding protein [Capsulimonas sp.]
MGWKIRKDKPGADEATDEPDGQNPDAEATSPQLPDDASDMEGDKRSAFVLDLDNDAFRTDSRHTSMDTSSFGWTPTAPAANDSYKAPSFDDPEPAYGGVTPSSLRDEARAIREESNSLTAEIRSLQNNKFPAQPASPPPAQNTQDFDLTSYLQNTQPQAAPEPVIEPGTFMGGGAPAPAEAEIDERHIYSPNTYSQPSTPYKEPELTFEQPRAPTGGGFGAPVSDFSIPKVSPFIVKMDAPQPEVEIQKHSLVMKLRNLSATYPLEKEITTIGRPDSDTQNYPDIEVDLDDGVSRKHAEVRQRGNAYFVVDVGSTNGTILNGEQIREFKEIQLTHGDRIRVGERTEIVFE